MEFVKTILEDYYEGRSKNTNETIGSIRTYSPCLDNVIYILGMADSQMDLAINNPLFGEFLYSFKLYKTAMDLARKVGLTDLEDQISRRCEKQFSRIGRFYLDYFRK